jgi:hypothetical protein
VGQMACDFSLGTGAELPVPPLTAGMSAAAQSQVDTQFWGRIMVEHALFFASFLPGNELADWRARALDFADRWATLLAQAENASYNASNYQTFNSQTLALLGEFIDFKQQLENAQDGPPSVNSPPQIFSLSWPSFDQHTHDEADWFKMRLQNLNNGILTVPYANLVTFWGDTMADHALFVVHLLDITETGKMAAAMTTAQQFQSAVASPPAPAAMLVLMDTIIQFKVQLKADILAGTVNSIIHPTLADHVRREAVKGRNEIDVIRA